MLKIIKIFIEKHIVAEFPYDKSFHMTMLVGIVVKQNVTQKFVGRKD